MAGKYNGWANWETWNVYLWLDNDEDCHRILMEQYAASDQSDRSVAREVKAWIEAMYEINHSFGDIQSDHELGRVDWLEIVRHARIAYAV